LKGLRNAPAVTLTVIVAEYMSSTIIMAYTQARCLTIASNGPSSKGRISMLDMLVNLWKRFGSGLRFVMACYNSPLDF
jgi:hypothetical protein